MRLCRSRPNLGRPRRLPDGVRQARAEPAVSTLNFFIRRDLRRAALLGWMTPFEATRSRVLVAAETAAVAAS